LSKIPGAAIIGKEIDEQVDDGKGWRVFTNEGAGVACGKSVPYGPKSREAAQSS
jgi:hypothetical protein